MKFDEVDLLDGRREKIEAVGKGLDMGPIKGKVYGKNTGKNLLLRSVSGIGSTLAMVFGNNTSSSFSEDDLIRERLALSSLNDTDCIYCSPGCCPKPLYEPSAPSPFEQR